MVGNILGGFLTVTQTCMKRTLADQSTDSYSSLHCCLVPCVANTAAAAHLVAQFDPA